MSTSLLVLILVGMAVGVTILEVFLTAGSYKGPLEPGAGANHPRRSGGQPGPLR